MAKPIRPLSVDLRNKIAAGEVIERPASVVKELVENSIDAGATRIDVVVEVGGEQLIQVTDDGSGINAEDLELAFERYATSKIAVADDLFKINSLGFRGEALASISSVADIEIESCPSTSDTGNSLNIRNGEASPVQPAPAVQGTRITVRNLFSRLPARRKFLKTPRTELRHIVSMIRRFALAHPQIAFRLNADGRELFNLSPEKFPHRIGAVFDPTYRENINKVEFSKGQFTIAGAIGNLNLVRTRPGEQYLFLNGRYINNRLLNSAVYSGYHSLIKRGEYPFFVLNLSLPAREIDVNVHPMKLEVRFKDEWRIYHVLKSAIEESLQDVEQTIPEFEQTAAPIEIVPDKGPVPDRRSDAIPAGNGQVKFPSHSASEDLSPRQQTAGLERAKSYASQLAAGGAAGTDDWLVSEGIFQIHNKYIVAEISSGMVIIDQHVAHERILFEEAQAAFEQHPIGAQTLLFPEVLEFAPDEFSTLLDVVPALEKIGFRLKEFGKNTIMVEAVPAVMGWGNERGVIRDLLDHYTSHRQEHSSYQDAVAASFACHAAIKAGDPLSKEEMQVLVNQLFATKHPYHCPHGRPIIVQLSLKELDKRFER